MWTVLKVIGLECANKYGDISSGIQAIKLTPSQFGPWMPTHVPIDLWKMLTNFFATRNFMV